MENNTDKQTHSAAHAGMGYRGAGARRWFMVSGLIIVLLAVIIGLLLAHDSNKTSAAYDENTNINTKEYQALFLTNGQVYFGKLTDLDHQYVTISDIYYLQVQQSLQDSKTTADSTDSSVSLAKLGNELHGPEDKMYVARDQVLFWENLKNNGSVVKAIDKYQSSN